MEKEKVGEVYRVAGPVVTAVGIKPRMYDVVYVGTQRLMGEVIQLVGEKTIVQVYEDTSGIKPGEIVVDSGMPLAVELGPGLLSNIYDGIQRPLPVIVSKLGNFIARGISLPALDREKKWYFKPTVKKGDKVDGGRIIGTVQETPAVEHRILVPPKLSGVVKEIYEGEFKVEDTVCILSTTAGDVNLSMVQKWPVRVERPIKRKLMPEVPLLTGQRIFDFLFPLAKGGTACIPGGFGTGKCVTGDTPVLLGDGRLVPIIDLYKNAKGAVEKNSEETLIKLEKPIKVFSFDGTKTVEKFATGIYKGTTDRIYRIKTRTGRLIELTPLHKLFRVENCEIKEVEAQHLRKEDYIISPRKFDFNPNRYEGLKINFPARCADVDLQKRLSETIDKLAEVRTKKELAELLGESYDNLMSYYLRRNSPTLNFVNKLFAYAQLPAPQILHIKKERDSTVIKVPQVFDEDFAEFLGYLLSEGSIKKGGVVAFYNNDERLLKRYGELLKKLFDTEGKVIAERTVKGVFVNSTALAELLYSISFPRNKKSRNLKVPPELLRSPEKVIKAFLTAYIKGDGYIGRNCIELSTASKNMASGLSYLLSRVGVLHSVKSKHTNKRVYYRIFISAKESSKISRFYENTKSRHFDSFNIVPLTQDFLINELARHVSKKRILKNYINGENMSVKMFEKVIQFSDATIKPKLEQFRAILNSIYCDRITEIEVLEKNTDVYDLTVPDTHNFIGGYFPMLLHNTVMQHQLSKWSDTDVVVYVGCGERGNEMTEVLTEFPKLLDPRTGAPLMQRTVLIANTSNMPVAAREASVYTGMTIAEYYRDMGYHVGLMADSTSRWAEAMREISSRLEEMPGEEGYPAYLAAKLSAFYERAGRVTNLNDSVGSVTVIGAVSPPGADFSEPVTQNTLRIVKVFWGLDTKLAQRRHFPAINWLTSYSLYTGSVSNWFVEKVAPDWTKMRIKTMEILQKDAELQEIVQLVGSDALPEREQLTLEIARAIKEIFLQQNAYHSVDSYCSADKQYKMLSALLQYAEKAYSALEAGAALQDIVGIKSKDELAKIRLEEGFDTKLEVVLKNMDAEFAAMRKQ